MKRHLVTPCCDDLNGWPATKRRRVRMLQRRDSAAAMQLAVGPFRRSRLA
jgi:hypothetical protein